MTTPIEEILQKERVLLAVLAENPDCITPENRKLLGASQVLAAERYHLAATRMQHHLGEFVISSMSPRASRTPSAPYAVAAQVTALQDEIAALDAEMRERAPFLDREYFASVDAVFRDVEIKLAFSDRIVNELARKKRVDISAAMAPIKWPKAMARTRFALRTDAALVQHNAEVFGISTN